jgi:hypothetical protein
VYDKHNWIKAFLGGLCDHENFVLICNNSWSKITNTNCGEKMGVMWLKKHRMIRLRLRIMKSKIGNSYVVKKLVKFTKKKGC